MMHYNELVPARSALAAYLARFTGTSRDHADSDLRCYLAWCAERGLDPFVARRPHLELYIRWMQEIRRFKPSTVSRRFPVAAGFYRTCVIDGVLEHSPAEYVRRPAVPAESPALGFTHLQFEALLTAARQSASPHDFALVAMLGLLGLRIFAATGADIGDLGEEHGHRVLRVCGKGKVVLVRCPRRSAGLSTAPPAAGTPGRSCSTAMARGWTGMPQPGGSGGSPRQRECGSPGLIRICSAHVCHDHARRGGGSAGRADCRSPRRPRGQRCAMTEPARISTAPPSYILAAYMASGT
jgi:hypothetical protein